MNKYNFKVTIPYNITRYNANIISNKLSNFNSDIYISKDEDFRKYNAKSKLGLISLELRKNDMINVEAYCSKNDVNHIKDAFQPMV